MTLRFLAWIALLCIVGSCGVACERNAAPASLPRKPPTLRIYAVSTLAGALEPCGCVKDMLGGLDHLAQYMQMQTSDAPNSVFVGAGPLLFMDPALDGARRDQHLFKAQAIAEGLRDMGLVAWAPGTNDWAGGAGKLAELRAKAGATLLAANLGGDLVRPTRVVEAAGLKLGLAGISQLEPSAAISASTAGAKDVVASLRAAQKQLDEQGARIRVALLAMPRGQALRAIEAVPGFQVAIVGKAADAGEANEAPAPATIVGRTLVVQAPNHLQGVGVIDLFVRGDSYDFADASGVTQADRRASLQARIVELKSRIASWERQGHVAANDLDARRRDLKKLEAELSALENPAPPESGSFFRYTLVDVREKLGSSPAVRSRIAGYYERVNQHNRELFKDRLPEKPKAGESGYVGVEQCTACHAEERKFWDGTSHARAYVTLASAHKEFNLDCVSCHVTGYEKPGGSTVTHVENLGAVQCEVCHGPGSRHAANPEDRSLIVASPSKGLCAPTCHHPPHVKPDWNVDASWKHIVGPGHGM